MDPNYLFMCGMIWAQFGEDHAGRELILALQSTDPAVRTLARTMLERARGSKALLAEAIADHTISPVEAGLCSFGHLGSECADDLPTGVWFPPAAC